MDKTTVINIARDFSKYPGGRFTSDGDFSGQRFRDDFLVPALRKNGRVVVQMDGALGYGSSFLEEAFGGLIRDSGFQPGQIMRSLTIETTNETLRFTVERYVAEAESEVGASVA